MSRIGRIVRVRATRTTAALAGVWLLCGTTTLEAFRTRLDPVAYEILLVATLFVFFLAPVLVFVFGVPQLAERSGGSAGITRLWRELFIRVFCWLLGLVAFGVAYVLVGQLAR